MKKSRVIGGAVIAAAAALLIFRIAKKDEPVPPAVAPVVEVQTPHTGDVHLTTDLVGTVEPADIVYIYPKAGGDITAVNIKAGDRVEAGQVICEIDTKQVDASRNAMDTAKIAWDDAQSTLNRMAPLHASGFVSDKEFESYQTNAEAKRLQYESAKIAYDNQMEFSHVTSPISGRVEQCNMEVHDTVGSSVQLAVIAGDAGNNVSFYVTERIKNNLETGDSITLTKEGTQYQGSVIEVSNMAEQSVGLFKVKAAVENGDSMAPGTKVELEVPLDEALGAKLIPVESVYYKGENTYVYTYDSAEGIIHEVPIETGIFDDENMVVLSGLEADDQVVVTWTSELAEGTKVTVAEENAQPESDAESQGETEAAGESQSQAQ